MPAIALAASASPASSPFCDPATPPRWIRPRHFRISHVELDVRIDLERRHVDGRVEHQVELLPHGRREPTLVLDQHDLAISAAAIDGVPARFSVSTGQVAVVLPDGIPDRFTLALTFTANEPRKGLYFIAADAAKRQVAMAWTQGAMEDHAYWFPCFDDPNNLSIFAVTVRHAAALQAVANGERLSRTDHGDGTATTRYAHRRPHVLYLLNLVVGDFVAVEDATGPVPITHWLPRGHEAGALAMFRATAPAIRWFAEFLHTPFPWQRYGHAVVHGFMWGGMENATLTTITDRVVLDAAVQAREDVDCDSLVVHELAHQWFGDLLTMKAWSDIWLNESFATWLEARATGALQAERRGSVTEDEIALHLWQNRDAYLEEDSSRYRRALVTNRYTDAYELFDRVAYEKGSLVLHLMHRHLGDDRMRAALALYLQRHAHGLVETADFRQAVEDATGEPLDWFFAQWVYRAGHPELVVTWKHDPGRNQLVVEVEQRQAATDAEQVYRLPLAVAWGDASGESGRVRVEVMKAKETLVIPCPSPAAATPSDRAPVWVVLDPDGDLLCGTWDETGDARQHLARLACPALSAVARARAAVALGKLHLGQEDLGSLAKTVADSSQSELVRRECLAALGAQAQPAARAHLITLAEKFSEPRLRRAAANALAKPVRDAAEAADLARRLVAQADAETSDLCRGECLAARAALEHPGATPELRARLRRDSWQQRLRAILVRGLGQSGEAAAVDDAALILADTKEPDHVRCAAVTALSRLGARHRPARDRVRRLIEPHLDTAALHLRSAAAHALGDLGDPAARSALSARLDREAFGNVRRVLREALETLGKTAAADTALAAASKRIDELETARKRLEARLDAVEKRLGG